MKYLGKYTPAIIVLIYVLIFAAFKSPEREWDRVINSDGKGYYAYLPAVFIYHDLRFAFVDQYEAQYYPANRSVFKEFRQEINGRTANKYFPGMAIICTPFFLLGHLMAWLEIYPADGYSLPYQYAIAFSAFFFLWLGARWLMKLLRLLGADDRRAAFLTFVMTVGTNLLYFSTIEASMSHVYSFSLITGFSFYTFRMVHDYRTRWFVRSLLLFTLIFLIRPTNLLVILLVPFLAGSTETLRTTWRNVTADRRALWRGGITFLTLLSVPVILWYLQTGKPLIYSYGEEKLNFFNPHILSILFSFNRGWFIYTPVALVSLAGLIGLYRSSRFRFWWLLAFLVLFIYIASCWWVWYYASKCGQRVFIDLYAVVAILLLYLYNFFKTRTAHAALTTILILLSALNLVQFYQHVKWIFPPYTITGEIYRASFFSLTRQARTFIPADGMVATRNMTNDMEADYGPAWMNNATRFDSISHGGKWSSRADKKIPYSSGLEVRIDSLFTTQNRIIRVSAWLLSPRETTEAALVMDFQSNGNSISYNQFLLQEFVPAGKWTHIQAAWYVPRSLPDGSKVKVYFFNPSTLYKLYVDDLSVDFISMKDDPDYRKAEGVLLPEKVKE